jgi:hypothetical protein
VTEALAVPQLGDDVDTLTAVLLYAGAGWYVLPVLRGTKKPGSIVGQCWQDKSSRDPKQITAWFAGTDHGIALHCGRSGAVVFDVDNPGRLPDILREHLGAAPYQSTRADVTGRGHYIFAQPPTRTIGNSTGRLGGAWGEVRGLNGVIAVEPTVHPDGGHYRWQRTGVVPALPDELGDQLDDASPADDAAPDEVIAAFIAKHRQSSRPQILAGLTSWLRGQINDGASRHQSTLTALVGTMKEAAAGFYPAQVALDEIKPMFIEAVAQPPASRRQNPARNGAIAESEFQGILAWSVGQALSADLDAVRARADEKMPDDEPLFDGDPIPLTPKIIDVPPFPVDALPDVIENMVTELAEATQTDRAMAATSALTVLAACVGGHAEIQVRRGWREPLCLFTNTVARPGERKSPVQAAMIKPIRDAEAELSVDGEVEHLKLADELDMAKKTVDQLNKAAVNAAAKAASPDATDQDKKTAAAAAQAARDAKAIMREIQVPVIPRLLADDATPEATASLLADHGGRIAIVSAEGGIFDTIAGRYAKTVNIDVYLKGHAGDTIRVDRQGRAPQYIPRPALTVGLMIQPRILETIAANRDFAGRGLLARFLYARPQSRVGRRRPGAAPVGENTESQYNHWIKKLASDMAGWAGDPAVLMLDERAEAAVLRIEEAIEPTLAEEGELAVSPGLTDWGSKYVGAVVRIAGLLHLAEHGANGVRYPVQAETIEAAERIGAHFKAAAINVFAEMDADDNTADAVYLLRRVAALDVDEVSERDLFTACSRSRFPTKADMAPALKRLVDHGYLLPLDTPKPTGGGRVSPLFKVHPVAAIAADAADAAKGSTS